jgi:hypothetical protein
MSDNTHGQGTVCAQPDSQLVVDDLCEGAASKRRQLQPGRMRAPSSPVFGCIQQPAAAVLPAQLPSLQGMCSHPAAGPATAATRPSYPRCCCSCSSLTIELPHIVAPAVPGPSCENMKAGLLHWPQPPQVIAALQPAGRPTALLPWPQAVKVRPALVPCCCHSAVTLAAQGGPALLP